MIVRAATSGDAGAIRAVHEAAFCRDGEAHLVERLVADGDDLVSLVAEAGGTVAGHILFSPMDVSADGAPLPASALAPIAVQPGLQRQGIGTALIETGLSTLSRLGHRLCFVLGDPRYYGRFGFAAATAAPFESPYAGKHFMACWIGPPTSLRTGHARHAAAFASLNG